MFRGFSKNFLKYPNKLKKGSTEKEKKKERNIKMEGEKKIT